MSDAETMRCPLCGKLGDFYDEELCFSCGHHVIFGDNRHCRCYSGFSGSGEHAKEGLDVPLIKTKNGSHLPVDEFQKTEEYLDNKSKRLT